VETNTVDLKYTQLNVVETFCETDFFEFDMTN